MPTGIDHLILGINNLDRGIAWVEQRTGVRAAFGGVHPGRGTQNALLSLGPDCYLEIMAPDPQQAVPAWFGSIVAMPEPKLLAWAAHTSDLAAMAQTAQSAGLPIDGPHDGARTCPDGATLRWTIFRLRDDLHGLLPFFIEWSHDSIHPAAAAPLGCRLESLDLHSPRAVELAELCAALGIHVNVAASETSALRARIITPLGPVELTS